MQVHPILQATNGRRTEKKDRSTLIEAEYLQSKSEMCLRQWNRQKSLSTIYSFVRLSKFRQQFDTGLNEKTLNNAIRCSGKQETNLPIKIDASENKNSHWKTWPSEMACQTKICRCRLILRSMQQHIGSKTTRITCKMAHPMLSSRVLCVRTSIRTCRSVDRNISKSIQSDKEELASPASSRMHCAHPKMLAATVMAARTKANLSVAHRQTDQRSQI